MKNIQKAMSEIANNGLNIMSLSGAYNAKARQHLMALVTGKKTPVAECGVNALREALYDAVDVPGRDQECQAVRDRVFNRKILEVLGVPKVDEKKLQAKFAYEDDDSLVRNMREVIEGDGYIYQIGSKSGIKALQKNILYTLRHHGFKCGKPIQSKYCGALAQCELPMPWGSVRVHVSVESRGLDSSPCDTRLTVTSRILRNN